MWRVLIGRDGSVTNRWGRSTVFVDRSTVNDDRAWTRPWRARLGGVGPVWVRPARTRVDRWASHVVHLGFCWAVVYGRGSWRSAQQRSMDHWLGSWWTASTLLPSFYGSRCTRRIGHLHSMLMDYAARRRQGLDGLLRHS
jgi:hypothetical protein